MRKIILTTINMQFIKIGTENTTEMKRPLLSKYCWRENIFQFEEATSFIFSEKYTKSTKSIAIINIVGRLNESTYISQKIVKPESFHSF